MFERQKLMWLLVGITASSAWGEIRTFTDENVFLMGGEYQEYWLNMPIEGITLHSFSITLDWEGTGSSWASDIMIAFIDGMNTYSAGGYDLGFGGTYLGPLEGSTTESGIYTTSFADLDFLMGGDVMFYLGNGWSNSNGMTTDFILTMEITAIPAPSAFLLFGLAGFTTRRRTTN